MIGSLMAASQPAAKFGVADHQAEATKAQEEIGDIEHALYSAQIDERAEHETKDIKSRLENRDAGIKIA
jgi:hypothetical protein